MRHARWLAIGIAVLLVGTACGGGKKVDESASPTGAGNGDGATTTTSQVHCDEAMQGTETGVTPKNITITVMADTGSTIRPGLFQGSVDGVKAWAKFQNAHGGLACRQVVVKAADSKLSPDDAKNGIAGACGGSFAMVGTTALFLNDMTGAENCKDKAGAATGLPDLSVVQTNPQEQCSPVSYNVLPAGSSCPYSGEGERTFRVGTTQFDYYLNKYPGENELHGVWIIPADLPSTIASSMPGFRVSQRMGIGLDAEFGASGLSVQSAYTPFIQSMKQHKSTYARNGLDYKGTVFTRKEAQVQGVDTVKVWDCSVQCYDKRLLTEGGSAVEDQYVWLNALPFEDKGHNETLDTILDNFPKADGFGALAWVSGMLFAQAVNDVVERDGPNGLTRAALLEALSNIHDFDADGYIPKTDIGARQGSTCLVGMQVKGGKFVRIDPTEPGKFDCSGKVETITMDASKEFKG
jgi:substrate-binding family protein